MSETIIQTANPEQPEVDLDELVRWNGLERAKEILKESYSEAVNKALDDGCSQQKALNALAGLAMRNMRQVPAWYRSMIRKAWSDVVEEIKAKPTTPNTEMMDG